MDEVPSPLQINSPNAGKPSVDAVPAALRAGSPATERGNAPWDARPPLMRKKTSGSSRLSQMFPSRPSSISSSSTVTGVTSRHTSHPSPLLPASQSRRTSWGPAPPPPPTFPETTAYEPSASLFDNQGVSATLRSSGSTRQLFSRLTSLRGRGVYDRVRDEDFKVNKRPLRCLEERNESLDALHGDPGAIPMRQIDSSSRLHSTASTTEQQHDLSEAGYAAEYERLESQVGLGAGMKSVFESPFTHVPSPVGPGSYARQPRGQPAAGAYAFQARNAQEEAEKTGDIVAVAEVPVDISDSFGGSDFETRSMLTSSADHDKSEAQKSYFFPKDPDMPTWRPLTMGWPWLAMLTVIALGLAALQEYLCQKSLRNEDGLAKFRKADELSLTAFFTWKYAPIIAFVFYGILWQMTDFEVKRLEPYYQLSRKTGATAGESLNMDYLTFMSWLVPLRALRHRQYAVIWSSLGTLVGSSLVPVLQSASIKVDPPKDERKSKDWKYIRIDPPWSRAVSGCLVFVAICGAALMYAMRRKSGLLSNPQGIAGIAAMATRYVLLDAINPTTYYALTTLAEVIFLQTFMGSMKHHLRRSTSSYVIVATSYTRAVFGRESIFATQKRSSTSTAPIRDL
jgi:hypothetical protein